MSKNKVKFGLKNVHVWPITSGNADEVTYGEVIKVPGAVEMSLDPSGDSMEFYADDIVYFAEFANNGYEGDLQIALIPEEFELEILGYEKDKNGAIVEKVDGRGKNYAMAFEFDGDVEKTRHIFYNVSSSRPGVAGKTKEETKEPSTDTLSLKAMPSRDSGIVKAKINQSQEAVYDDFFTTPYIPVSTDSME